MACSGFFQLGWRRCAAIGFPVAGICPQGVLRSGHIMKIESIRAIAALLVGFSGLIWTGQALAQESDAANEVTSLKTTNQRLLRENETLREEVDALKRKLAEGKPTTRPITLSAAGAAT